MMSEGVGVGLLLVERGRQFVSRWSDYLVSVFIEEFFFLSMLNFIRHSVE